MLDVHAGVSAGNVTALTAGGGIGGVATVPNGDGASNYGVPLSDKATLMAWGAHTIAADTLYELQLISQDQADPLNGEWFNLNTTSVVIGKTEFTSLPYVKGNRKICIRQNTGAGLAVPFTIDYVADAGESVAVKRTAFKKAVPNVTIFGGALTAQAWGSQAFAPANAIPNGKYAILGASADTFTNVALLRFLHPDFKGYSPGFPVVDSQLSGATSYAQLTDRTQIYSEVGTQFIYMSELTGLPMCPVFHVSNNGTGLVIQAISTVADTPRVNLSLAKLD